MPCNHLTHAQLLREQATAVLSQRAKNACTCAASKVQIFTARVSLLYSPFKFNCISFHWPNLHWSIKVNEILEYAKLAPKILNQYCVICVKNSKQQSEKKKKSREIVVRKKVVELRLQMTEKNRLIESSQFGKLKSKTSYNSKSNCQIK